MKKILLAIAVLTATLQQTQAQITELDNGNVGIGTTSPSSKLDIHIPNSSNETFINLKINNAPNDYFKIQNATSVINQFIPKIYGKHTSDNREALYLTAAIGENNDEGSAPLMVFDSRFDNKPIQKRPLFGWDSYGQRKMTLNANGNLGLGTSNPTDKLTVVGNVNIGSTLKVRHIIGKSVDGTDDGDLYLNLNSTKPVVVGSLEKKANLIVLGGNIGIRTSNPEEKLHILGDALIQSYSPMLKLRRSSSAGGFTQGIQTELVDKTPNFYFGALSTDSWIIANGKYNGSRLFTVKKTGNVGIGTSNPDHKLTVKGGIHCEEVLVDLQVPADYVFEKYYNGTSTLKEDYKMPTLAEVEAFTKKNHHLPSVPSAKTIQKEGLHLKEMTNLLLQKIEELTLYTIEQEKRINALEKKAVQRN